MRRSDARQVVARYRNTQRGGESSRVGRSAGVSTAAPEGPELGGLLPGVTDGTCVDCSVDDAGGMQRGEAERQARGARQEISNGQGVPGAEPIGERYSALPFAHSVRIVDRSDAVDLSQADMVGGGCGAVSIDEVAASVLSCCRLEDAHKNRSIKRRIGGEPFLYVAVASEANLGLVSLWEFGSHPHTLGRLERPYPRHR